MDPVPEMDQCENSRLGKAKVLKGLRMVPT